MSSPCEEAAEQAGPDRSGSDAKAAGREPGRQQGRGSTGRGGGRGERRYEPRSRDTALLGAKELALEIKLDADASFFMSLEERPASTGVWC